MPSRPVSAAAAAGAVLAVALSACSAGPGTGASTDSAHVIVAVGAESQYANVTSQIGGRYVQVTAIERNPNTDPHTFEASPSVARTVGSAELVVQNGIGYDAFMNKIEAATPDPARKVIVASKLLGLPDSTPNPHLWYMPSAMPAVARAVTADLAALQPRHAAYFRARQRAFAATSMSLPVVGALLIFSLMVGPPAAARSFTSRPLHAMALSVVIALATVWAAIAASYLSNWPVGFFVGTLGAVSFGVGRGWAAWRRGRPAHRGARRSPHRLT